MLRHTQMTAGCKAAPPGSKCRACGIPIPVGSAVFFTRTERDGEARETYVCESCHLVGHRESLIRENNDQSADWTQSPAIKAALLVKGWTPRAVRGRGK